MVNKKDYRTLGKFVGWYKEKTGSKTIKSLITTGNHADYIFICQTRSPGSLLSTHNLERMKNVFGLKEQEFIELFKEFNSERR